jgi:hypothetical protein
MMARVSQAYKNNGKDTSFCRIFAIVCVVVVTLFVARRLTGGGAVGQLSYADYSGNKINAVTWNVAAINNNPFEYWITNEDPKYNSLMKNVSSVIQNPGAFDVPVNEVFSDKMFDQLLNRMTRIGWKGMNETKDYWTNDFRNRKIISQFVKDPVIGKKRLASMPDRVTNTMHTYTGASVMRPTVINCFEGDLSSTPIWFAKWMEFFFDRVITVKKDGRDTATHIYKMLPPISKAKYPDITTEEAAISIPLQTLSIAIFDAILVHMLNTVGADSWQPLRNDICTKLNRRKNDRTVEILQTTYGDADVQFLQEVAGNFRSFAAPQEIGRAFDIYQSESMDTERDQNSFILLKKGKFTDVVELTAKVNEFYSQQHSGEKLPLVNGDLIVLMATDATDGAKYLLASFHGDTNGYGLAWLSLSLSLSFIARCLVLCCTLRLL